MTVVTQTLAQVWGDNIRRQRLALRISQRKLGTGVGVSGQAVNRWEHGQTTPRPALQIKVAEQLHADPRLLFPLTEMKAS